MTVKDTKLQWRNKVLVGLQELVADMIAELDLQVILQKAVERTAELVEADIVTIHIYDPPTGEVRAAAGYRLLDSKTFQQREPGRGKVALLVASKGEPVIAEDVSASELAGPFAARESVQSAAGFPLKVGDEVIGVLFVNYREPHKFEPEEVETLVSFGHLVTVAINAARSYEQAKARTETIRHLGEIGQSLTTLQETPQVLQATLERIANTAIQVLGADAVDLYQYRADRDDFVLPPIMVGERRFPDLVPGQISPDDVVVKIVRTGEKIYASDAQEHPVLAGEWEGPREERPKERFVVREGIASSAAVPMKVGEEVLGVLFASYRQRRDFDADVELRERIEILANQAAIAIQNARLLANVQRQAKGHQTLNKVGTTLTGILDEEAILKSVARAVANTLDCTHCTVFRVEDENLVARAAEGNRGWSLPLGRTFSVGQGVAGWVAQMGISRLVAYTHKDERFDPGWSAPQPDPQSLVVVPILLEGEVYGVISAEQDRAAAFDEQDQQLLETLALQTSQAVRNARLHADLECQIERLQVLNQVSRELSTELDEKSIFEDAVKAVVRTLDCTHCAIFVLENNLLMPRASHGKGEDIRITQCFALGEGLAGWVAQEGKAILARDAKKHEHFHEGKTRPDVERSMIVVPVRVGGQVLGVISADQDRAAAFDEGDLQMVETLALQTGIALQTASLIKQERQRGDAMDLLQQVSAKISVSLDLEETLALIIEGAMRLTGTDSGVIHLVDEAKQAVIRSYEVPEGFGHLPPRFSQKTGMTWTAVSTGQTIAVSDITKDECVNPAMAEKGVRAIIGTPLKVEEETIGVLFLNDSEPHEFTEYEKELLSTLAGQAAIAIENVRLFERRAQDISALAEINEAILAKDLDEITQLIADKAAKSIEADYCVLRLIDSSRTCLIPKASSGRESRRDPLPIDGSSFTGWVASQGKAELCSDVSKADHYRKWYPDVQSCMAAPLMYGDRLIGTLYVESTRLGAFSEESQLALLQSFADQAAIAIENARLFQELEERAKQFERLQEVTATISADPSDFEKVLELIVASLNEMFGGASCAIRLYDSNRNEFGQWVALGALEDWWHPPRPDGTSWSVIKTKTPRYVGDTSATPPDGQPSVRKEFIELGVRAIAYLPLVSEGDAIGILYLNLTAPHQFSQNEKRILDLFADQATIAIENARLYHDLNRRIGELEVLTEMSRGAISDLGIDQILDLVYEEMGKVIDLSDAQVQIAFYDEVKDEVSFPMAAEQDRGKLIDRVRWSKREEKYRKPGEDEVVEQFKSRARRDPPGLNEHVVRTKEPLLITGDPDKNFEQKATDLGIKVWPTFGWLDRPTYSWLGVPMMVADRVIGVISIQSLEQERAFDEGQQELLTTVASQAAVAIENARLYNELKQAYEELERVQEQRLWAELGKTAGSLAHRIGNKGGIIRVCAGDLVDRLQEMEIEDELLNEKLDMIQRNIQYLLEMSDLLFKPVQATGIELEKITISLLVSDAIKSIDIPEDVSVKVQEGISSLPQIPANRFFVEVFVEIINNALVAMESSQEKKLTISGYVSRGYVEVWFTDTGPGIPPDKQKVLFDLFTRLSDKEPPVMEHRGFGLWWVKSFLMNIGGEILFESIPGKGSTFIIRLPLED